MTRAATGTYRGVSADERRAQRRRRLLDAALDVVGTQGMSAATVRGICEQAKVGPRFFYESFADVDELVGTLYDELLGVGIRDAIAAMDGAPQGVRPRTEVSYRAMIHYLIDDPRRARVMISESYGSETLVRHRAAGMRTLAAAVLATSRELLALPAEHERVLRAVSMLITGGVTELVMGWLAGGTDLNRDELVALSVEFTLLIGDAVESLTARIGAAAPGAQAPSAATASSVELR